MWALLSCHLDSWANSWLWGIELFIKGKLRRPSRIAILLSCFAALALWVAIDARNHDGASTLSVVNRTMSSPDGSVASRAVGKQTEIPSRATLGKIGMDPFSVQSWPPSPARGAPGVAAVPVVPPLPYRFAGQLYLNSGIQVFLARGDETIQVKEGDTIEDQYRVESIDTSRITLVHIASGTRQVMDFGPPLKDPELAVTAVRADQPAQAQAAKSGILPALSP